MIYFASDFHLGAPGLKDAAQHEKRIRAWLQSIRKDAKEVFLLGDLFDFWFEYKHVVPKGFLGFLSDLKQLSEQGIQLHIFKGNHDLWFRDYFEQELDAIIYTDPVILERNGIQIYLAHGDGLGPGDRGYKAIKWAFTRPLFQWMFRWIHPDVGISIAQFWSKKSSQKSREKDSLFLGEEKEWLIIHSKELAEQNPDIKYMIYGHRHYPLALDLNDSTQYINLGDWIQSFTYAQLDGEELELKRFIP
ncbi:MAG: UDP-2,3-diacylglucosamine hydrolase [Luteibaculaceae bacterium]|jgi:UDP-2,3-diacylglucosamine hydrolase